MCELKFAVPTVGGSSQPEQLVGECKAHQAVVNLTDWLKFVGKVHVESVTTHQPKRGLFVALSGVNGNVKASYRALVERGQRLTLIEGEQLVGEMLDVFGGVSRESAVAALETLTSRQFTSVELAYRLERLYWVFTFADGAVALLKGDGNSLPAEEVQALQTSVSRRLDNAPVLDLLAEKEARRRSLAIQKRCIALLFDGGGLASETALHERLTEFSQGEVGLALNELAARSWIRLDENGTWRLASDPSDIGFGEFRDLLTFFVTDGIHGSEFEILASSELYAKLFDERAIEIMSEIQCRMPILREDRDHVLWLTRHSPSALHYALREDLLIVTHRKNQKVDIKEAEADAEDARRFMRNLVRCFSDDFRQGALKHYYFDHCRLVELEVEQRVVVKGKEAPVLNREMQERIGIGQMADAYGGGLIHISLYSSAPQPWEWPNKGVTDERGENPSKEN